ncbi:hypothetical protein DpV84gp130 [Deerpox virus W-1170-84]|uniref:Uncharacterized protein n=1 Tax=Deerpox virus (strain W-1170-84) TaxID=305676 RepID=Q08F52_DPV84|nr:hypothetical protein DpV84gp130 [Deerpox virus W-1170-84]AYC44675.1 hypothetical protein [Moosepox virus GoldyGopher14]
MDILNMLKFLEKSSFYNFNLNIPKNKSCVDYKNNKFIFYKPKEKIIRKYLTNAGIYHNDIIIFGKIIINDNKLLFFYMDLFYYGINLFGDIYKLGREIDNLSLNKIKSKNSYYDDDDSDVYYYNTYSYDDYDEYDNYDDYDECDENCDYYEDE